MATQKENQTKVGYFFAQLILQRTQFLYLYEGKLVRCFWDGQNAREVYNDFWFTTIKNFVCVCKSKPLKSYATE